MAYYSLLLHTLSTEFIIEYTASKALMQLLTMLLNMYLIAAIMKQYVLVLQQEFTLQRSAVLYWTTS